MRRDGGGVVVGGGVWGVVDELGRGSREKAARFHAGNPTLCARSLRLSPGVALRGSLHDPTRPLCVVE